MNLPEEIKGILVKRFITSEERYIDATEAILAAVEASLPQEYDEADTENEFGYNQCLAEFKAKLRGGK